MGLILSLLTIIVTIHQAQAQMSCQDVLQSSIEVRSRMVSPLPAFLTDEKSFGAYRNILQHYRGGSNTAKELAYVQGLDELAELGMQVRSLKVEDGAILIKPEDLPKPKYFSFHNTALTHPKMAEYLAEINRLGYRLVVDPRIGVQSDTSITLGSFNLFQGTIRILPNASWYTFIHEFQHLKYGAAGLQEKEWLKPHLKSDEMLEKYSKKIKPTVDKMKKRGFSDLAIDETLSVGAEITSMYLHGYTPMSFPVYHARSYAWQHQLRSLTGNSKRAQYERAKIRFKQVALHPVMLRSIFVGALIIWLIDDEDNKDAADVVVLDKSGKLSAYKVSNSEPQKVPSTLSHF
jgi:hypothetical protein